MSVDTKGVIATSIKDPFFVARRLMSTFNAIVSKAVKAEPIVDLGANQFCQAHLGDITEMFIMTFKLRRRQHTFYVHFDCDSDHKDLADHSISMQTGYCPGSAELMQSALEGLSVLGPCYLEAQDGAGSPGLRLLESPTGAQTYLDACKLHPVDNTLFGLQQWMRVAEAIHRESEKSLESIAPRVFGMPMSIVVKLLNEHEARPHSNFTTITEALIAKRPEWQSAQIAPHSNHETLERRGMGLSM